MHDEPEIARSNTASSEVSTPDEPEAAGARIGRYTILRVLGEGGMGVVYAAYDDELERRVAIKLVRTGARDDVVASRARARMQREAQAMAQLAHPNVVRIYDVGRHGGGLFIAMELIRGATLEAWLTELGPARLRVRRWPEIVSTFVDAAQGLAAAHAAGLVHRDFKPANVLVSADGSVHVGDFGLARGELGALEHETSEATPARASVLLSERMTETGAMLGTPAYASPEQLFGREIGPASDQFSFCVALYEALLGERPFAGDNLQELAANLMRGNQRPRPTDVSAPAWLLSVIDRGLAREPAARWPSMTALIEALIDDPARRRRRWFALGLITTLALGLAGGLGAIELRTRDRCAALGDAIEEVWNPTVHAQMAAAFQGSGAANAEAGAQRAAASFDQWSSSWRAARINVCLDVDDDSEQQRRREACLDQARWGFEAIVEVLAAADRSVVIEAPLVVAELPELARCEDVQWLAADVLLTATDDLGGERVALRRELARVYALEHSGRYADALALAESAASAASSLGDPAIEAEALAKLGGMRYRVADFSAAEQSLLAGHLLAGRIGHDRVAYATARDLVWVVGVGLTRTKEAHVWLELARMNLARMGEEPEPEPELLVMLGELEFADGNFAAALAAHQQALALREARSTSDPEIVDSLINIGRIHVTLGDDTQALTTLERARELALRELGPDHPWTATADSELGMVLDRFGRLDEAITAYRRSIAVRERALGSDDPSLAATLGNLAAALNSKGELLESLLLFERASAIYERSFGPNHARTLGAAINYAVAKAEFGEVELALELLGRTLVQIEATLGPDSPLINKALYNMAFWLKRAGRPQEARAYSERALALDEATFGPDHVTIAPDLLQLGLLDQILGDHERAVTELERAAVILDSHASGTATLVRVLTVRADSLDALGREDEAARERERAASIGGAPSP